MSAHSVVYDKDPSQDWCDHRHCISLAESACWSCENRFCDAHGDVEEVAEDEPGVCWECIKERSDREAREASVRQHHCAVLYTEADLCSPW
jgi:hypothetical protein